MASSDIISALGAGSGIDITNLVSQLVEVESAPQKEIFDKRQESLKTQISAYGQLRSALDTLQTAIGGLGSNDLFNARSVSVPDTDVITADSVSAGAQTGTYKIEVLDVASAQSLVMAATDDGGAALGKSGEMTIRLGEWTYDDDGDPDTTDDPLSFTVNDERAALSISIEESDSLETIAEKINGADAGVNASVLEVDGQYQLMLTSPSGKSNALEISVDDASLDDFAFNASSFANVTETQQAHDASLKINGLTVSRETNSIDDVIDGFEFTLNKAAPGESLTYSVTADKGVAEEAIRDFVDAYNSFQETAKGLVGYTRDDDNELVRGELAGDGTARTLVNRLRELVGGSIPGLEGGFTALTNIGIRTELDGTLSIEEDELESAVNGDFELIESLFATKTSSANSAVTVTAGTYVSEVVAGTYSVEITQDPTHGEITGNAISHADFDSGTDTFTTALDASAGSYSFKINVDGIESSLIELTGVYSSADELRADLQTRINGDDNLKAAGVSLTVDFDGDTDQLSFVSDDYGAISNIGFSQTSADMAALGIEDALVGTAGLDVEGTVNGVAGFGAGNALLPDLDSDAYGLRLTIEPGAAAQGAFDITYSRGLAGELSNLIDAMTGSSGEIAMRENNLGDKLDEVDEDRTKLDTRMEVLNARLLTQFTAMEAIVGSLQSTGDQLEGLTDRLPFTASG